MSQTTQQGPFFIERGANTVAARSKRPFSYAVYWKAHAAAKGLEESREKEFYCGICKGWVPISSYPHSH